jgi:UDP-N-acetyl-D-galactosamine dehydrogenase
MGPFVVHETVKLMIKKGIAVNEANVLVLGITFKEDCPDIRNSRAIDIVNELKSYSINVDVFDPWASPEEVKHEYGIDLISDQKEIAKKYDAVVIAVSHKEFKELDLDGLLKENHVKFDVKAMLSKDKTDSRL